MKVMLIKITIVIVTANTVTVYCVIDIVLSILRYYMQYHKFVIFANMIGKNITYFSLLILYFMFFRSQTSQVI